MASSRKPRPADPPAALAAFLSRHRIETGRLCVGLSGGVDSVALLHALAALRERTQLVLTACHVHHGLSPNADRWADFCAALCRRLAVPLAVERVRPLATGRGLEAAAREARLQALAAQRADGVVLAHHADDQAETLLYRLFRGSGVLGAGAMRPLETLHDGGVLLRPLLALHRGEIEAWARAEGLAWIEDESNAASGFDRNYIRRELMPHIVERFAAAPLRLAAAAAHFREAQALLEQLAELDWQRLDGDGPSARLDPALLDAARLASLLRWRLRRLGCALPDEARLGEAVRQLRGLAPGRPLRLSLGEAELCGYRGRFWLQPALGALPAARHWHGEAVLGWDGGEIRFEPATGQGLARSALSGELTIEPRRPGERLRLRPGGPARTLKNLAQEAGVPPWLRERLPALRTAGRLLWVAELGVACEAACGPGEAGLLPRWQPADGVLSRLPADP